MAALLPVTAEHLAWPGLLDAAFWKMFFFFALITVLVCVSVIIAQQKDSRTGVQMFLAATVTKLLACMVFALIYALSKPASPIKFMGVFFYLYFVFTAFEIYSLLTNLRDQNR